jgi:hypothetical protein
MNRKELKEELNIVMGDYLAEKGFKIDSQLKFVCKTKNCDWWVFLAFNHYDTVQLVEVSCKIQFREIERRFVHSYYHDRKKSEIVDYLKSRFSVMITEDKWLKPNLDIYLSVQVVMLSEILIKYIEEIAIPFFESHSDFHFLNEKILSNDLAYEEGVGYTEEKYNNLISVPIIGTTFHGDSFRLYVMKYCNDTRYEEFIKWNEDGLNKALSNVKPDSSAADSISRRIKTFRETIKFLESNPPL